MLIGSSASVSTAGGALEGRPRYLAPVPSRVSSWLVPATWVAAITALLLLLFPVGFPNYDTIYALVWGRELAHGVGPDYGAALPPTPHPLADLLGLVTTPIGDGAITVTMIVAYASLGLVGYLVYRLGSLWFDRWIGAIAAAIVLTRAPFLSNGLRAYVDLPYIALCLGALAIEARRPRAGWPVLALLLPAGLLRPEAWLFAGAYWLYLALDLRPPQLDGPETPPCVTFQAHRQGRGVGAGVARGAVGGRARVAGGAGGGRPGALGSLRRDHHRGTALLADRDARNGRDAEAPDRPGRPRPLRAAPARRSPAVAGDGRGARRRRARLRLPAPALRAGDRGRAARPRSVRAARLRRPRDHRPLHDARRRDPLDLRRAGAARVAPARRRPSLARALAAVRGDRRADVRDLAPEPVEPRLPGRHRPHQPGEDRG